MKGLTAWLAPCFAFAIAASGGVCQKRKTDFPATVVFALASLENNPSKERLFMPNFPPKRGMWVCEFWLRGLFPRTASLAGGGGVGGLPGLWLF